MDQPVIKAIRNGPYHVKGALTLLDAGNKPYVVEGEFWLCRCGQSKNKPFCDSTHREVGFQSVVQVPEKTPTP